jgi:hypothetical protein
MARFFLCHRLLNSKNSEFLLNFTQILQISLLSDFQQLWSYKKIEIKNLPNLLAKTPYYKIAMSL